MFSNFFNGIMANSRDMGLFFDNLFHNHGFLGFMAGIIIAVVVIGFILTKNPKHIPIILKYSEVESFQRIAHRDKNGTYLQAFSNFVTLYTRVRTLFLTAFIALSAMIITAMLTYR
ncbi:MAG: hypothetical protein ABH832_02780 [bacterium]